jgi:hypothetical protein
VPTSTRSAWGWRAQPPAARDANGLRLVKSEKGTEPGTGNYGHDVVLPGSKGPHRVLHVPADARPPGRLDRSIPSFKYAITVQQL